MFHHLLRRVLGVPTPTPRSPEQVARLNALVAETNRRAELANELYEKCSAVIKEHDRCVMTAMALEAVGDTEAAQQAYEQAMHMAAKATVYMRHADSHEAELIWLLPAAERSTS